MKNRITIASKDSKVIAEVRGKGFMIGIELVKDKQTREPISDDAINKVIKKCQGRGAWVFPVGRYRTSLRLLPPLVITRAYFEKGVDIVLNAIRECESEMVK
jgi:4-aminobutyrate aminotransferase-like enzyme